MSEAKNVNLYGKLSADEQKTFSKDLMRQLKTLIGGYGELSVLAEYVGVMLQCNRPREQIRGELEAFLQDQSDTFTDWLFERLAQVAGEDGADAGSSKRPSRRERKTATEKTEAPAVDAAARRKKHGKEKGEAKANRRADGGKSRSRQRRRRRDGPEVADVQNGGAGALERKAVLTPNMQSTPTPTRDPYTKDTRWHFRAEPTGEADPRQAGTLGPPPGYHGELPPGSSAAAQSPYRLAPGSQAPPLDSPPGYHGVGQAPAAAVQTSSARPPRGFQIKKWRVARQNTVVKATEALESPEIQTLQEGEIVEQVAPAFKLASGIIRVQIRHPSSPQFPNPIGWVTQDASAAGGPVFLEPGPEPMVQTSFQPRPAASPAWPAPGMPGQWRPRGGGPPGPAAPGPAGGPPPGPSGGPRGPAKWGAGGYQNLTWTPNSGAGKAAGASEPPTATA